MFRCRLRRTLVGEIRFGRRRDRRDFLFQYVKGWRQLHLVQDLALRTNKIFSEQQCERRLPQTIISEQISAFLLEGRKLLERLSRSVSGGARELFLRKFFPTARARHERTAYSFDAADQQR